MDLEATPGPDSLVPYKYEPRLCTVKAFFSVHANLVWWLAHCLIGLACTGGFDRSSILLAFGICICIAYA